MWAAPPHLEAQLGKWQSDGEPNSGSGLKRDFIAATSAVLAASRGSGAFTNLDSRWHQERTFEPIHGGTAIDDVASYRGLGWFIELLVNRLFIRPDVVRIFTDCYQQLLAQDGSVSGASSASVLRAF